MKEILIKIGKFLWDMKDEAGFRVLEKTLFPIITNIFSGDLRPLKVKAGLGLSQEDENIYLLAEAWLGSNHTALAARLLQRLGRLSPVKNNLYRLDITGNKIESDGVDPLADLQRRTVEAAQKMHRHASMTEAEWNDLVKVLDLVDTTLGKVMNGLQKIGSGVIDGIKAADNYVTFNTTPTSNMARNAKNWALRK